MSECELTAPSAACTQMLPTLAWVTVAAKLNVDIVNLNADKDEGSPKK